MDLKEYLISRGYPQAVACPLDGEYRRFDHAGALSGWFKGRKVYGVGTDKGFGVIATFGDFKTGEAFEFKDMSSLGTAPETAEWIEAELAKMKLEEQADRKLRQEQAAKECELAWADAIDRGTTPYLKRKGLNKLYGAKICPDYPDTLMVPARDVDGKLWTIQRILPAKLDSGLDKLMKKGGKLDACFHTIGSIDPEGTIYVCEGFATGASIYEALSVGTVCAFNARNLASVGASLRDRYPSAKLVFCGDDDQWTERNGKPWNPGREKALAAATATGGVAVFPHFASLDGRPTDFNDLHTREGLERVKGDILNPPAQVPEKKKRFSEKLVTDWMLEWTGGKLARQDKSLFHYNGTHWTELDSYGIDTLKNKINSLCGDNLTSKDVASIYNTFFRYVPAVPKRVNLFQPRSDLANFQNGTLHLEFRPKTPEELAATSASGTHVFHLRFAPHAPGDFCTTVIPIDYRPKDDLPENDALQSMFKSVWPDADQAGKVMLYEEVLGACLIPHFPQLFFFLGEPKTGKSSLIMLLGKLVGSENASHSDPTRWDRSFGMASMVNKLVNYVTDISTARKLPDDLSKQIIDGVFEIERKHKTSVLARLPAIHAFGANSMPKTGEGDSGAYDRRVIIIRTDTVQPGQGGGGQFSDWIWERGRDGVLKAALRGLERLLSNGGIYTVPESARKEMRSWQRDNDPVVQFIEAVELGEITVGETGTPGKKATLVVSEDASISVAALYEIFCGTVTKYDAHGNNRTKIVDRINFVKRLYRDKRIAPQRNKLERRVTGIGIPSQEQP